MPVAEQSGATKATNGQEAAAMAQVCCLMNWCMFVFAFAFAFAFAFVFA
jgi:hypothetical protein